MYANANFRLFAERPQPGEPNGDWRKDPMLIFDGLDLQ
jgi:hypothetical protein